MHKKVFGKAVDRIKNIPDLIVRGNGFALPEVDRDTALTEELFKFPKMRIVVYVGKLHGFLLQNTCKDLAKIYALCIK